MDRLRVLLVAPFGEEVERDLLVAGHQVTCAYDLDEGANALRGSEPIDVTVLSHPIGSADLIAACSALRGVPESPPLVLLDATGQSAELDRLIPKVMHPTLVLPRPVDGAKLAEQLETVHDEPSDQPAGPDAALALAKRMLTLEKREQSGDLIVKNEGRTTKIQFMDGRVVGVLGGSMRDSLGRGLMRGGELSKADYLRVIERMSERAEADHPMRMGEVLVELGLLSPTEVFDALGRQLAEKVVACFRAPTAIGFQRAPRGSAVGGFALPTAEALAVRGLVAHHPAAAARAWLEREVSRPPALGLPPARLAERLQLSGALAARLYEIDPSHPLGSLIGSAESATPAEDEMALLLLALRLVGQLGRGPVPVAEEPPAEEEAKPEPARAPSEEEKARRAEEKRNLDRLEAERRFRLGQNHLAADRVEEALTSFSRAVELEPLEPEYRMYEAWAAYQQARVEARIQRARLTACARKVAEEDASSGASHTILGFMALDEGNPELARQEFEAALLRDPEDKEARNALDKLR